MNYKYLMYRTFILPGFFLVWLIIFIAPVPAGAQIEFNAGAAYRYLKGSEAASLSDSWNQPGFDASGWSMGSAPIRYGDGSGGTELTDMQYNYSVVYMLNEFSATSVDLLGSVKFSINFDDGFALWINGQLVLTQYAPADLTSTAFASASHESGYFETFVMQAGDLPLVEGTNSIAVQGLNVNLESTDFYFDMSIQAAIELPVYPDSVGPSFSASSGFYTDPFNLQVTASEPSLTILYTLDGSNPQDSESAISATGSMNVLVDPASSNGRAQTPAFIIRVSTVKTGYKPSYPIARTFIFLESVKHQTYPGGDWPSGSVNSQIIDLDMDQRVVTASAYKDLMDQAFTDIPSISIITDNDNLFDPQTGIYVNAEGHGFEWERECSVELINPDQSEGFNVNAGLRIRGGWSRHPDFPKHSFRLFFREEYGDIKLYFPLFGVEGTESYDKIDLRTAQNYAWSNGDSRNTMVREVFSRDSQRDMNQPYTRSRYYHLYLNGMYWGIFQTQERSEARYASDYLGGDDEDYDVIKVDTEDYIYQIEATDGYLDTWRYLWNMTLSGFEDNAKYFSLMGLDAEGNPDPNGRIYVNIDNLIDYMIVIFYTGNFDSPTSSFGSNKGPNNFYAIFDRKDLSDGFTFYVHDAEHSLFPYVASPGEGLYENRVNLASRTDNLMMNVSQFGSFHPQWLHYKLTANAEYRMRFADRAFKNMEGEGVFTPEKARERFDSRAEEIDMAIIAESARWGDAKNSALHTRNDHWLPELNRVRNDFFPARTDIVIGQMKDEGLYTTFIPPELSVNGNIEYGQNIKINGRVEVVINNLNSAGNICYSLDGKDPRMPGGGKSPTSVSYNGKVLNLQFSTSEKIMARIYYNNEWSALREFELLKDTETFDGLAITEISYHPPDELNGGDTIYGTDLEFLELKNTSSHGLNLYGLRLDTAIYFEFNNEEVLAPGQFYVVASKPAEFYWKYRMIASGNYSGHLANSGEQILLTDDSGNTVIDMIYNDTPPWPATPDGFGYTLAAAYINPTGDPSDPYYWKASAYEGGSPFADDQLAIVDRIHMDAGGDLLVYPNPTSYYLNISFTDAGIDSPFIVTLYTIEGVPIYQDESAGFLTIDLQGLNIPEGLYILKIDYNGRSFIRKIIFE